MPFVWVTFFSYQAVKLHPCISIDSKTVRVCVLVGEGGETCENFSCYPSHVAGFIICGYESQGEQTVNQY